jgi:hypothetical protein
MYYAARAISFFCCLLLHSLLGAQTTYRLSGVVNGDDLKTPAGCKHLCSPFFQAALFPILPATFNLF